MNKATQIIRTVEYREYFMLTRRNRFDALINAGCCIIICVHSKWVQPEFWLVALIHDPCRREGLETHSVGRIFNAVAPKNLTQIFSHVLNLLWLAIVKWIVFIWQLCLRRSEFVHLHLNRGTLFRAHPKLYISPHLSFLTLPSTITKAKVHLQYFRNRKTYSASQLWQTILCGWTLRVFPDSRGNHAKFLGNFGSERDLFPTSLVVGTVV